MPLFKKIKIRAKTGRGNGTTGMLQQVMEQYEVMKSEFDAAPESEQNEFVKALDEFEGELGTDFTKSKIDFECNATSINNIGKFMQLLQDLGFDVVMPED